MRLHFSSILNDVLENNTVAPRPKQPRIAVNERTVLYTTSSGKVITRQLACLVRHKHDQLMMDMIWLTQESEEEQLLIEQTMISLT